jgi:hypothetical protein
MSGYFGNSMALLIAVTAAVLLSSTAFAHVSLAVLSGRRRYWALPGAGSALAT